MGYRGEEEGLRLRIAELEEELAGARDTIARLQGHGASAGASDDKPGWFTGAPRQLQLERELPFEITDAGYEAIAELLRARMDPRLGPAGHVSQVGRALTYRFPGREVRVAPTGGGRTSVRITANHGDTAVLLGMTTAGGSLFPTALIAAALKGLGAHPASLLVVLPFVVASCFLGLRALFRSRVENDRKKQAGVLESIAELAAKHAQPKRARIPAKDASAVDAQAESEAQAAAEAAEAEAHDEAAEDAHAR